MSAVLLVLGTGAFAAAALIATLVVLPAGPSRVPLSRLDPSLAPSTSALAGAGAAAGAAVEKVLLKRGRLAAGAAALDRAGMSTTLPNFVLGVGLTTVLGMVIGALLGGLLLAVVVLALVPFGAKLMLGFRAGRRQAAFADQLDDSLQLMASSLRAGHSLLRAVDSVSHEAESPTSDEFSRIVNETRVGRDLNDALDEVAARMGSEDFTWVAQAIAIHREVGGNLAEVLDAVGNTIRERNAIRRQVKALSAEGKLSAIVLMALPFGVTGFLAVTNPEYLAKFTESIVGYGMLAGAAVMLLVGGLWLKKTVAITF
ncbi:type II secretion system F family protein [Blastococcus goldschmidtiae]|uniref:Type II secretion system F family protein n=1 Tax=Blastococcus goldschmidtiae TaxID=3075546 RepID=A0ABU2K7Q9_9ACTN|nr:type II secretion system F family protein [Blastococcus sp. DSM 46792]MDT0276227.1 type II secretion system F family protein [Blastococcus sp. DSM 46792]